MPYMPYFGVVSQIDATIWDWVFWDEDASEPDYLDHFITDATSVWDADDAYIWASMYEIEPKDVPYEYLGVYSPDLDVWFVFVANPL